MTQVCFVTHADLFTPWPIMRAKREIEILKGYDFEITAVSWIKDKLDLPKVEERDGVKVHRFFLEPPQGSLFKRVLTYRSTLKELTGKILQLKPNAIVCHDLEILPAGVKAKKILKIPLFYDAHENWPAMVSENSRLEGRLFAFNEKRMLKHVAYSYTYGPDLEEKFRKMGHSATTLYNSKTLNAVPEITESEIKEVKQKLGLKEDDFIVGFSGSVNLENGTQQVIDALKELPENIKFLVVGGSGRKEDLENVKKYAKEKGVLERVIFTGRVPSDALLRYTETFDVGTALFQPLNANQIARMPNKLFDYMSLSVPMIVSNFPNMRKVVVSESDCGKAVDPMNIQEIAGAIMHYHDNPEEAKEKGKNGRAKFETLYCWDVQKKKLLDSHPLWRGKL